jgi:hypothetical protein
MARCRVTGRARALQAARRSEGRVIDGGPNPTPDGWPHRDVDTDAVAGPARLTPVPGGMDARRTGLGAGRDAVAVLGHDTRPEFTVGAQALNELLDKGRRARRVTGEGGVPAAVRALRTPLGAPEHQVDLLLAGGDRVASCVTACDSSAALQTVTVTQLSKRRFARAPASGSPMVLVRCDREQDDAEGRTSCWACGMTGLALSGPGEACARGRHDPAVQQEPSLRRTGVSSRVSPCG